MNSAISFVLCRLAGVPCRASGSWTERKIELVIGDRLRIEAEPGDYGAVRIWNVSLEPREALLALAYGVGDLVAKASITGHDWARPALPLGRKTTGRAKSVAERQRAFRARKKLRRPSK